MWENPIGDCEIVFMKVLIINTVNTRRNGITNVIFNLYHSIDKNNISFDLVTKNVPDHTYTNTIEISGGKIITIPKSKFHVIRYIRTLKGIIRRNRYEMVHIHGNSHTVVLELLAAKLAGCKVRIVHAHSTTCNSPMLHKLLSPLFHLLCTHRLACGQAAGQFMHGNHAFTVINNGVNTEKFSFHSKDRLEIREQYQIHDKIVIGHVGNFVDAKNPFFLIDILANLKKTNLDYCMLLVGDGPLLSQVKEKTKNLGLTDSVIFVGATDNVPAYISACDVIMMPSLFEGLPLTLIEQQTNGLKCLVSDQITTEVDKTGNIIFLPIDKGVEPWVSAMRELDLSYNREAMSRLAVEKIKQSGYDIRTEAKNLRMYYDNCVKE